MGDKHFIWIRSRSWKTELKKYMCLQLLSNTWHLYFLCEYYFLIYVICFFFFQFNSLDVFHNPPTFQIFWIIWSPFRNTHFQSSLIFLSSLFWNITFISFLNIWLLYTRANLKHLQFENRNFTMKLQIQRYYS